MTNPRATYIMGLLTAFAVVIFYMERIYEVPIKTVVKKIDNFIEVEELKPNFTEDANQIKSSLNQSKLKHVLIYIHALCDEYHVPYDLAKSVIMTESSWNHKAISKSGAIGLMQIKPETAYSGCINISYVVKTSASKYKKHPLAILFTTVRSVKPIRLKNKSK